MISMTTMGERHTSVLMVSGRRIVTSAASASVMRIRESASLDLRTEIADQNTAGFVWQIQDFLKKIKKIKNFPMGPIKIWNNEHIYKRQK